MFSTAEADTHVKMFINLCKKFWRIIKDNPEDSARKKKIFDDSKHLNEELKEVLEMSYEIRDYCKDHQKQQSQKQSTSF